MRIERAVTTVSWIPSDSLSGMLKAGEKLRFAHHDEPPPDQIGSPAQPLLEELRDADRFRFANLLRAWVEVEDGAIVASGYSGGGHMGSTTVSLGVGDVTIAAVAYPDLPCRAGGRRGLGAVPPDDRGSDRHAHPPPGQAGAVLPVHQPDRVDDAGADHLGRRPPRRPPGRRQRVPPPLGLRRRRRPDRQERAHRPEVVAQHQLRPADAVGHARRRRCWSPRSRPRSSGSSRPSSCAAAPPTSSASREGDLVAKQGQQATSVLVLLDGVLAVEVDGHGGGRARPRRRRGGAGRPRGRRAHGDAPVHHPGPHRRRQPGRRRPPASARPRRRPPARGRGQRRLSGRGGAAAVGSPGRRCHCGRERRRSLTA